MRSADQISRTVGQWHDFVRASQERALREFLAMMKQARARREQWVEWIDKRSRGEHDHQMTDEKGQRIACPVGGCRE